MNFFKRSQTIFIILLSLFAPFGILYFLLGIGANDIFYNSDVMQIIIMALMSLIAFYGANLYYMTYIEKKNVRDFVFSLAFYVFGITFLLNIISIPSFFIFDESVFEIMEHHGVFLGALFLLPLVFLRKMEVPFLYQRKAEAFFATSMVLFGAFTVINYNPDFLKYIESKELFFAVMTTVIFLLVVLVRSYFILKGGAQRHIFLASGVSILASYGLMPFFYADKSIIWWYAHIVLLVGFLFILISWFKNQEFEGYRVIFKNAELGTKVIITFSAIMLIFFSIVFYVGIKISSDQIMRANIEILKADNQGHIEELNGELKNIKNDVLYLSNLPVWKDGNITKPEEEELRHVFSSLIVSKKSYLNIRYLNDKGDEVMKVGVYGGQGESEENSGLKNRLGEDYFINSFSKNIGQVFISDFSLNKEEDPQSPFYLKPVIHSSTPVFDSTNNISGVIVLDVLGTSLLENIDNDPYDNMSESVFVLDRNGYFIYYQDKEKEWGSTKDLNTGYNVRSEIPEISDSVLGLIPQGELVGKNDLFAYKKVYPNDWNMDMFWTVGMYIPSNNIFASLTSIRENIMSFGFLTLILFMMVSYYLVRKITNPIKNLSKVTKKIIEGDNSIRAEVTSENEIGQLAANFNNMVDNLIYANMTLESKVNERTQELADKVNQVEAQVRETMKFQKAVESATDGIVIADRDENVLYVNKAWEGITGIDSKKVLGKHITKILGENTPEEISKNMASLVAKDKPFVTEEIAGMRKNGEKYEARISLFPVKEKDQIIFFVALEEDITKRKEIDRAKTEFVSLASHQLRTPLSIVNWRAEMMLDGSAGKLSKKQKTYLEDIYKGNTRMIELVNSLLNISRIELGTLAIEPENINLKKICEEILHELTPKIEKNQIKIKKKFEKGLPIINADPKLVTAIFQNLLSNAVKYTKPKGTVSVEVRKEGSNIAIDVSDNGIGVPKRQQSKIFTKLFRADNAQAAEVEGTGLGLYIIKSIVDNIGGKIWFESDEGKGTTFHVLIPEEGMKKKEGRGRII